MAFWSRRLATKLLDGLTEATLRRSWGSADACAPAEELRDELAGWSLTEDEVRRLLMADWRSQETEVVEAVDPLAVEELIERWEELEPRHGSERLLLALLTEADEDTEESVELLLAGLASRRARRAVAALWRSVQDREDGATRDVLLVGGDPSERPRVDAIGRRHRVRVTWIPAERGRGYGPSQASLVDAGRADLVLVVTGRIGHSLMHGARRAAQRLGVPCRYVERLSERQVAEALDAPPSKNEVAPRSGRSPTTNP